MANSGPSRQLLYYHVYCMPLYKTCYIFAPGNVHIKAYQYELEMLIERDMYLH